MPSTTISPSDPSKKGSNAVVEQTLDAKPFESLITGLDNQVDITIKHSKYFLEKTRLALDKVKNYKTDYNKLNTKVARIDASLDLIDNELDTMIAELERCQRTGQKISSYIVDSAKNGRGEDSAIEEILALLHCNSTENINKDMP